MVKIFIEKLKEKNIDLVVAVSIFVVVSLLTGFSIYHPDENIMTGSALRVLRDKGNPGWFMYPAGILFYLNAIIYGAIFFVLKVFSSVSIETFANFFHQGHIEFGSFSLYFHTPARFFNIIIGAVGVIFTYKLTNALLNSKSVSFLASLLLAISPLWISNSKFFTVDVPLGSMAVVVVYYTIIFFRQQKFSQVKYVAIWSLLLAVFMSMKYYSILQAAAIFLFFAYYNWVYHKSDKCVKRILIGFFLSSLFYFLTNPYLIIDYKTAFEHIFQQFGRAGQGHFGFETKNGWVFHIFESFPRGLGAVPFVFSLLGSIAVFFLKNLGLHIKLFLVLATWPLFLFLGMTPLAFDRYMLAIYPQVLVFSAVAVYYMFLFFKFKFKFKVLKVVVIIFLISQQAYLATKKIAVASQPDTREVMTKIIDGVFDYNTTFFAGLYTREILIRENIFSRIYVGISNDLKKDSNEIIIFDSFSHDRVIFSSFKSWQLNLEALHGREGLLERELNHPFYNFDSLFVVRITPYSVPKNTVEYSPNSIFAPALPDLIQRVSPGPFIEMHIRDEKKFSQIIQNAYKLGIEFEYMRAKNGYFLPEFNRVLSSYLEQSNGL